MKQQYQGNCHQLLTHWLAGSLVEFISHTLSLGTSKAASFNPGSTFLFISSKQASKCEPRLMYKIAHWNIITSAKYQKQINANKGTVSKSMPLNTRLRWPQISRKTVVVCWRPVWFPIRVLYKRASNRENAPAQC